MAILIKKEDIESNYNYILTARSEYFFGVLTFLNAFGHVKTENQFDYRVYDINGFCVCSGFGRDFPKSTVKYNLEIVKKHERRIKAVRSHYKGNKSINALKSRIYGIVSEMIEELIKEVETCTK